MKKYICQKPCTFGDRRYIIGEEIPAEQIDPSRVNVLLKYGTISAVDVPTEESASQEAEDEAPAEKPGKKGGRK